MNPDQIKDKLAADLFGTDYSNQYVSPNLNGREPEINQDYIDTLPDLQNGPASLIKGSPVKIQQVGIHNFRLPLRYKKQDGGEIELETSVTGTVSLEAVKKGINMSRIMRTFYEHEKDLFCIDLLDTVLGSYQEKLESFDASIILNISYPMLQESLRSKLFGWQYYNISLEARAHNGKLRKFIHFDFVYSSTCPCSNELAEHARKHFGVAAVAHSQRSIARITCEFTEMIYFEELQQMCLKALHTETQVMVKREDEQKFAIDNGSNPKFVEDAVRQIYEVLNDDARIMDFRIVACHSESLHSHSAVSVLTKGIPDGLDDHITIEMLMKLDGK